MDPRTIRLAPYLQALVRYQGSDLHLTGGKPPKMRIADQWVPFKNSVSLPAGDVEAWILESMDPATRDRFHRTREADWAIDLPGHGRFRANAYRALGVAGVVARRVADTPLSLADLGMPDAISALTAHRRGLIVVTGQPGQGKSTSLNAMVDQINHTRADHIITIEDPIEVLHADDRATITQRELGADTDDWHTAVRAAMRQRPDCIVVGEIRDEPTMAATISAATSGPLVLTTLHALTAADAIGRIVDFFPPHQQARTREALAQSLCGVICQRLLPSTTGERAACAVEILIPNHRIREAILDPTRTHTLPDLIAEGGYDASLTFDAHLVSLVRAGTVTVPDAVRTSSMPARLESALRKEGLLAGTSTARAPRPAPVPPTSPALRAGR